MNEISTSEYRELLRTLPNSVDTDTERASKSTLFTPAGHRNALDPNATVTKGARGVGKTYWFQSLLDSDLRALAADEYQLPQLRRVRPLIGFSTNTPGDLNLPGARVLKKFLDDRVSPLDIWYTVGLTSLGMSDLMQMTSWSERIAWLLANPEKIEQGLRDIDREAIQEETTRLLLFDALEHLHQDRATADKLVSGILEFALQLRLSTRNLRAKVFIRHDMMESAPKDFPDSSKLLSNTADLTWQTNDLYGLLFQHLGNAGGPISARFRENTGTWSFKADRFTPPEELIGSSDTQLSVLAAIAGEYMGKNHRKGKTYTWLPNHLADGKGQTSPRTFLIAIRTAADTTGNNYAGHTYAIHWDAIRQGVQRASGTRVDELREDQPWVAAAINPLEGNQVPIEQDLVIAQWKEKIGDVSDLIGTTESALAGPVSDTYPKLIEELISLGMMTRRRDGRLDLPDVYRLAFGLGRKGGVPRVRV